MPSVALPYRALRLAPGIILSVGVRYHSGVAPARLIHVASQDEVRVPFRCIALLEAIAMGQPVEDPEGLLDPLVKSGHLVESSEPLVPCPVLREVFRDRFGFGDDPVEATLATQWRGIYDVLVDAHSTRRRLIDRVGLMCPTPETDLRRAAVANEDAQGKKIRIVCIGDAGFVAIALAALGHQVSVFVSDDAHLALLAHVKRTLDLTLDLFDYDSRDPVPTKYRGVFDAAFIDPVAHQESYNLTMSRAFAMLDDEGAVYTQWHPAHRKLLDASCDTFGISIRHRFDAFNGGYDCAFEIAAERTDWVVLEATSQLTLPYEPDAHGPPMGLLNPQLPERPPTRLMLLTNIENARYARPMFLELLVDTLQENTGVVFDDVQCVAGNRWSTLRVAFGEGVMNLVVNLEEKTLAVELFPHNAQMMAKVGHVIEALYKPATSGQSNHPIPGAPL